MNVQQIMTSSPHTCRYTDTLLDAAAIMSKHDCGCVPVVDDADLLVGMITDRDICLAAYAERTTLDKLRVSNHMASRVHTCGPEDDVATAAERMRDHAVRRLAVTGPGGKVLGLLSLDDLVLRGSATRSPRGEGLDAAQLEATLSAVVPRRSYGP